MHPRGSLTSFCFCMLLCFAAAQHPALAQDLTIDPETLDFGQVTVGSDRCLSVMVYNRTLSPVSIVAIRNPVAPFPTSFPDAILPGAGAAIELCFQGRKLGPDSVGIAIVYDAGERDSLVLPAQAFGWDSLALGIGATIVGKPGSVVDIPIRVFGDIPASYDLREFAFTLQFNKTMLYPLADAVHGSSLTAGMTSAALELTRAFDITPAEAHYRVRGGSPLINPAPDSILINARFLVLHGNAMTTDLTLLSSRFGKGMPRSGVFLKGKFVADSICFQDLRLVEIPDQNGEAEIGSYPNPFSGGTLIHYRIATDAHILLTVYNMLGESVRVLEDAWRPAGRHVVRFDAAPLPEGVYHCVLRAGHTVRTYPIFLVR